MVVEMRLVRTFQRWRALVLIGGLMLVSGALLTLTLLDLGTGPVGIQPRTGAGDRRDPGSALNGRSRQATGQPAVASGPQRRASGRAAERPGSVPAPYLGPGFLKSPRDTTDEAVPDEKPIAQPPSVPDPLTTPIPTKNPGGVNGDRPPRPIPGLDPEAGASVSFDGTHQ